MRKATKQKIVVLFIILIFGMSSIAFVVTGIFGSPQDVQKPKTLDSFVVDGELDSLTESEYFRRGFTIMKYYYSGQPDDYITQLPEITRMPDGAYQLIVEKIQGSETYVQITGPYGDEEIRNVTSDAVLGSLCNILYYSPVECALMNMGNATS